MSKLREQFEKEQDESIWVKPLTFTEWLESKLKEAEDGEYCFGCGYSKEPEPYTDANAPRICKNVMCKENELKKQ